MPQFQAFLDRFLPGNAVVDVLWFLGLLGGGLVLRRVISIVLSRVIFRFVWKPSEAKPVPAAQFVALVRRPLEVLVLLFIGFVAFDRLSIPAGWNFESIERFGFRLISLRFYQAIIIGTTGWLLVRVVRFVALIFEKRAALTESRFDDQLVPFFKDLGIVFVVIMTALTMLSQVLRIDVGALVAGLGIGGLAIALAARETLENLFASFTIFLDHPFVVGDTVQIGTTTGDVERVGFRSTRIRTADGSLITVPNRLMITQALENLSQRDFRRARYLVKLTLDTPADRLRHIVEAIQQLLTTHERTRYRAPFVWFDSFGESSLDILVVYFVRTPDWRDFNEVKEAVNYGIMDIVQRHEARFANPAGTGFFKRPDQSISNQFLNQ